MIQKFDKVRGSNVIATVTTSSAVPDSKATQTRGRIVRAAAHEFALHGFESASLRRIAEGADLHTGSLYFHFATKAELLTEVMRDAVDAVLEEIRVAVEELGPDPSGGEQFRAAVGAHLRVQHVIHDRGSAVVRVIDPSLSEVAPESREHTRRYVERWRSIVAGAQRDGVIDPSLSNSVVVGLVLGGLNATVGARSISATEVDKLTEAACGLFLQSSRANCRNQLLS